MQALTEKFKTTRRKNAKYTCEWLMDGIPVIFGYGNTKEEARESAEEVAQRIKLLNRPAR